VIGIASTRMTDHELGLPPMIPMSSRLGLDIAPGLLLMASPSSRAHLRPRGACGRRPFFPVEAPSPAFGSRQAPPPAARRMRHRRRRGDSHPPHPARSSAVASSRATPRPPRNACPALNAAWASPAAAAR
jgi:hypothetical protein